MILISYTTLEPAHYIEPFQSMEERVHPASVTYLINGRHVANSEFDGIERLLTNCAMYRQQAGSPEHPYPELMILPVCPARA